MSTDEENTSAPDLAAEGLTLSAVSAKTDEQPWTLHFDGDTLHGTRDDTGESFTVQRDETLERLELLDGLFLARALSVKPPGLQLKFEVTAYRALKDWIGQHRLLRMILRTRLRWDLPIGILFVLLALPISGDPEAGIPAIPVDWLNALLGALLILSGLLGHRWPHPRYLLLDSFWWAILAAMTLMGLAEGDHKGWILLLLIQLRFCYSGFRDWNRFCLGRY